jgi:hypothetical protein
MNSIQQAIRSVLPARHKSAAKGWTSFNAPCCTHNGESLDKRSRGGMLFTAEGGASYHCFNCNFKTTWRPGLHFGFKMRKLMGWMGMDEGQIQRIVFDALRQLDHEVVHQEQQKVEIKFDPRELPAGTSITEWMDSGLEDADLIDMVNLYNTLVGIKMMIIAKMNSAAAINTFLRTRQGLKVTSPEGYVAIDHLTGGAVKLVDRLGFSQANFSPDIIKGWEK